MRIARSPFPALALLFAVACTPAAHSDVAAEEAAVRSRSAAYLDAARNGDVDRLVSFAAPDAIAAMPNSPLARGRDAFRTEWNELLQAPNLSISWEPSQVQVAGSGDLAVEFGTYQLSMDGPQGRISDEGHYTTVWRKTDGNWLIASDMVTSSVPLPTS